MNRFALGGTLLLAGAMLGCSNGNDPDDNRCEEAVSIAVSSGTTPSISWTPVCTVALLRISEAGDNDEMWAVFTSANTILPGVTYGVTPTGATATRTPLPLALGIEYRAVVSILDPTSNQYLVTGTTSFTP